MDVNFGAIQGAEICVWIAPKHRANMKFLVGFICGVLITCGVLYILGQAHKEHIEFFTEKGECVTRKTLKVFQVIGPSEALVKIRSNDFSTLLEGTPVMLLVNQDGETYYDDEIIEIPARKCAKQIGIYQYWTIDDRYKTVPVVSIE